MRISSKIIIKNKKGSGILSFLVVVAVMAILAIAILPPLSEAISNRIEATANSYNGTDTITELE
jgi:Tfp pilus assembly protein PilE